MLVLNLMDIVTMLDMVIAREILKNKYCAIRPMQYGEIIAQSGTEKILL